MSRKRKTVEVERLKQYVNDVCLNSSDDMKEGREALGTMLENILMETGNYKGFGYLNKTHMEKSRNGVSVGIHEEYVYDTTDEGYKKRFADTDHTRVRYQ